MAKEGGRLTSSNSCVNIKLSCLGTKMAQYLTKLINMTTNYRAGLNNNFDSMDCNCSTVLARALNL